MVLVPLQGVSLFLFLSPPQGFKVQRSLQSPKILSLGWASFQEVPTQKIIPKPRGRNPRRKQIKSKMNKSSSKGKLCGQK